MRIVAFSDFRVQDIQKTIEFAEGMNPDVILYAGDDIDRFGLLDQNVRKRLMARNRSKKIGMSVCESLPHDSWMIMRDGEMIRSKGHGHLHDTYYFRIRTSSPARKSGIIDELSRILDAGKGGVQESTVSRMLRHPYEGVSAKSLLNKASFSFKRTCDGAEGVFSINTEDYVRRLGTASRYGFGAVLGNDDDPIYKTLLNRDNAFDIHDKPMRVNGFVIIGQEGSSLSDGRGIGSLIYAEDEIERHLCASLQAASGSPMILVSHTPPYKLLDRSQRFVRGHIGSPAVRRFIARHKPLLVFCGHVHSHGGCEARVGATTVINLASHDSANSPGRVCVADISEELKITTRWFLVLHDRVLDYSARQLGEGETLNSVLNIHGVGYETAQRLELHDIRTVDDVGVAGVERLCECGIGKITAQKMIKSAEALRNRKAVQLSALIIPEEPLMFVDIETDLAQSYIWLISAFVEGRQDSFRQFYAKTPAEEKSVLCGFLSYCKRFRCCAICYYSGSGFDERVIKNQITAHKLDGSTLGNWFDLCLAIKRSVTLPTGSFALKVVSDYFGHTYRHLGMDGRGAASEYMHSIGRRDEPTTKRLLEYAEDDVMSMHHIISNMHKVAGIVPDRSWKPPRCTLPVSFEEECILLRSLRKQGLTISQIAVQVGKSQRVIRERLEETPEDMKGRKVTFDLIGARDVGVPLGISRNTMHKYSPYQEDRTATGTVVEQISKSMFRVKAKGTIFQVSKKFIDWA